MWIRRPLPFGQSSRCPDNWCQINKGPDNRGSVVVFMPTWYCMQTTQSPNLKLVWYIILLLAHFFYLTGIFYFLHSMCINSVCIAIKLISIVHRISHCTLCILKIITLECLYRSTLISYCESVVILTHTHTTAGTTVTPQATVEPQQIVVQGKSKLWYKLWYYNSHYSFTCENCLNILSSNQVGFI